jgi:hypothetical protein
MTSVAVWLVATGVAAPARAVNFEVTGDVVAQGYEVASPWGDQVLGMRRLGVWLGLAAYNLQGDFEPFKADYSIAFRMRFDNDFGIEGAERSFEEGDPTRFVPGIDYPPVDLMYGWIEGRNIADGWFGFRVGRQYMTDVLGWWSFDGGLVRLTTPFFLQAEIYGGLEQRGGLPLSTSRFEAQGVWRGSHNEIRAVAHDYPSYQFTSEAPAFGFALESTGVSFIHGRFDYRRVYNLGPAFTSQFPVPDGGGFEKIEGLRISSERFGYAASAFIADLGAIRGGFAYDLYNQLISKGYGGIEFYPVTEKLVVGADVDFFVPTFDGDSIWNWFTHNPVITALGRVATRPVKGLDISASGGARLWMADGDPEDWAQRECAALSNNAAAIADCIRYGIDPSLGSDATFGRIPGTEEERDTTFAPDVLANLGVGYAWWSGRAGLDGMLQTGVGGPEQNRGRRVGGTLSAQQALYADQLWLGGNVSAYNWNDPLRPDRDATSFGYMIAPEYRPIPQTRFRVEWEHDMNRLVGQRFRIVGVVGVRVAP